MRRIDISKVFYGIIILMIIIPSFAAFGQTVNVTMRLNTSTNPDTVMEHHYVDARGECTGDNLPAITWDNATGIVL